MKIKNEEVSISIGNKTKTFKNLILNSYLDLFADSFVQFSNKSLIYCLINFTKDNVGLNETSTTMLYDTILSSETNDIIERLTNKGVINKYSYINTLLGEKDLTQFDGKKIKEIGFADINKNLYAFIDVSKYNLYIQKGQPFIISRVDKIISDMKFWSNTNKLKGPIHLTNRGLVEISTSNNISSISIIKPILHSVGFGFLPYKISKEYLVNNLALQRSGIGEVEILGGFSNYKQDDLCPSINLYPSPELYPKKATYNYLMYKYIIPNTNYYYMQYKEVDKYGQFNKLKIKYERG